MVGSDRCYLDETFVHVDHCDFHGSLHVCEHFALSSSGCQAAWSDWPVDEDQVSDLEVARSEFLVIESLVVEVAL